MGLLRDPISFEPFFLVSSSFPSRVEYTREASLFLSAESASQGHLDLTELIGVPLPSSVSFVTGYGGFPAYSFGPGANVGRPARTLIPPTFFRDFAISVTVKPNSARGGVLFAITDAFQKVIYLGLRLSGAEDGHQRVILYYTEPGSQVSHEAAAFLVPVMTHRWNRFAVIVRGEEVSLLVDCEEHSPVPFQRSSQPLAFEPSAGIFVGNAGATGLERFTVSPNPAVREAAGHRATNPSNCSCYCFVLCPQRGVCVWWEESEPRNAKLRSSLKFSV